jgi:D-lactate dehydrogenase (cytochrome)
VTQRSGHPEVCVSVEQVSHRHNPLHVHRGGLWQRAASWFVLSDSFQWIDLVELSAEPAQLGMLGRSVTRAVLRWLAQPASSRRIVVSRSLGWAAVLTAAGVFTQCEHQDLDTSESGREDAFVRPTVLCAGVVDALTRVLGTDGVSVDSADREDHGRDKYSHHHGSPPAAVIYPRTTGQVSEALKVLHAHRVPVVAYGSGTSLEGHTLSPAQGVVMNMSRMDKVLRLDVDAADVTVEAGIQKDVLNEVLVAHGLFFPVDPGPGASIGGMCATSCSGTNAVKFGTMKENVLSLTTVLADGTVVRTGQRSRKSSAGYDLTHVLIGSEGTLGIITEATLRLRPLPERTAVALASFPSIGAAAHTVISVLREGIDLNCVELMDETMVRIVNEQSGFSHPVKPTLFFKFAGTPLAVNECQERARATATRLGAEGWVATADAEEIAKIWQARKVALWSAQAAHPDKEVAITDVCVPVSRLAEVVVATQEDIQGSPLVGRAPIVGHVGDGNFHCFLTFDPHDPVEVSASQALMKRMALRAIASGGTCTGEHGIGVGKREYLEREKGQGALHMMRLLKTALDPRNILNPGKVLPPIHRANDP